MIHLISILLSMGVLGVMLLLGWIALTIVAIKVALTILRSVFGGGRQ